MAAKIHPSAVIDPTAEIGDQVEIGPGAIVGPKVVVGEGTVLRAHSQIIRHTRIGKGCDIYPSAVIGGDPQDLKYRGEDTELVIGDHNTIRECATINRGTVQGGGKTVIGDRNLIMAYVHIAHDCEIGNHVVITNLAQLAGHVRVEDRAILSGMTAVHHFCTVGTMAFLAPYSGTRSDVPPYMIADGQPAKPRTINSEGLARNKVPEEIIHALKDIFKLLYRGEGTTRAEALEKIEAMPCANDPVVRHLINFYHASEAGVQGRALEAHRADR